jgi:hypothetical protein
MVRALISFLRGIRYVRFYARRRPRGTEEALMHEYDKSSKWLIQHHGDSILRLAGVRKIESSKPQRETSA